MKILAKTKLPDGTDILIEDWHDDLFEPYGGTLATFPIAIESGEGMFSPKKGKEFRCAFEFENYEETRKAYDELVNGTKQLADFKEYLRNPKNINYIPHEPIEDDNNSKMYYRQQLELARKNKIWVISLDVAFEVESIFKDYFSDEEFEKACELIELAYLKSEDLSINQLTRALEKMLKEDNIALYDITRNQLIEKACLM